MSTTATKITKKDFYSILLGVIDYTEKAGAAIEGEIAFEDLRQFINHEIELLDNKTAAAQKRAAEKRQEGDILRQRVYDALSDAEFMTIEQIVEAIGDSDVTRNMVTSRLTQLYKSEMVEKDQVSAGGEGKSRKISAYRRKI